MGWIWRTREPYPPGEAAVVRGRREGGGHPGPLLGCSPLANHVLRTLSLWATLATTDPAGIGTHDTVAFQGSPSVTHGGGTPWTQMSPRLPITQLWEKAGDVHSFGWVFLNLPMATQAVPLLGPSTCSLGVFSAPDAALEQMPTETSVFPWRSLEGRGGCRQRAAFREEAACGRESGRPCARRGAVGPLSQSSLDPRAGMVPPGRPGLGRAPQTLSSVFSAKALQGGAVKNDRMYGAPPPILFGSFRVAPCAQHLLLSSQ